MTDEFAARRAKAAEVLGPRGVLANALQVMRIPGTEDHLGNHYDGQVLRIWADWLIQSLEMYDFEIVSKKQPQ